MNQLLIALMLAHVGPSPRAQAEKPLQVAHAFLPPNGQLAELYTFDYRSGRVSSRAPAVVTGHIVSPNSEDIVFAYYSPSVGVLHKTLFITLIHRASSGYQKEYELCYRSQVLLVPNAIQVLHLEGLATDVVAVVHGVGAALGGQLDVFRWDDTVGLENTFPADGSAHYVSILPNGGRAKVRLGFGKAINAGPFRDYVWDGTRFVRAE
jgi:hypothetical protein